MEIGSFFDFSSNFVLANVKMAPNGLNFKNEIDDTLKLIKGDYECVNFPVVFKQAKGRGKRFSDILDTGWPNLYLISDKMKAILEENKLTGWQTYPIKLYDKKGNEIFGYHGFSVVGHCGPVSYKKSQIIEKRYVPNGPICKLYKGQYFDNWDGTDFFMPEGTYPIFITKKAADILKKNKITNLRLKNLAEKEVDIDNIFIKEEKR